MKFLDLFSGIGGIRLGLEQAGHECVGFCEFDKFAVASYTSMHLITDEQREYLATLPLKERQKEILKDEYRNGEWFCRDIRTARADDIPAADCWCFGAPCFVAGTLVQTGRGLIPIEDVCMGDSVLTHKNRYQTVLSTMRSLKGNLFCLKVQGDHETVCTGNHRFYVRYRSRKFNSKTRLYDSIWSDPEWKEVQNFTGEEYVLIPVNQRSSNDNNITKDEAWLIGRYVADGYLRDSKRKDRPSNYRNVIWCVSDPKKEEFETHIGNFKISFSSGRTCGKYRTYNKRLFDLCLQCGKGAENKVVPSYIINLPNDLLECFLDGYMSGDGYKSKNEWRATSVSKKLIYGIAQIVNKIYKTPWSIYYSKREKKCVIEGRTVNQKDSWVIAFRKELKKQTRGKVVDGNVWMPVKSITPVSGEQYVYNMEVENDNSYTANGLAAHNCQDFSQAGLRKGMEGDRSSLIREVFRLLRETKSKPEWILYENVRGMLSSNRGYDFLYILSEMAALGYDIEYELLNSKYYGVPQNRERVFTIGHLRTRGPAKVFPLERTDGKDSLEVNLQSISEPGFNQRNAVHLPEGISRTLIGSGGDGGFHYGNEPKVAIRVLGHRANYRRNMQTYDPTGIVESLDTAGGGENISYDD